MVKSPVKWMGGKYALAKRIVENYLKPNFRNNNFYKGIDEAKKEVKNRVAIIDGKKYELKLIE